MKQPLAKQTKHTSSKGFTIIELMIATMVFSVILLVCAAALIQIGRIYQKNTFSAQAQETTRKVTGNISESIQFSAGKLRRLTTVNGSQAFCLDSKRYSYLLNTQLVDGAHGAGQSNYVLVVSEDCNGKTDAQNLAAGSVSEGDELLSPNMRILELAVCAPGDKNVVICPSPPPANSGLYEIKVTIAYGDVDLFANNRCVSSRIGGSFCATSSLSTTVQKRIIK